MKRFALAGLGIAAALGFAPLAGADPTPDHSTIVRTQSPPMVCQIGSNDTEPGIGPNIVCQSGDFAGFPGSGHLHQAVVTAAGALTYRDANIGMGGDDFTPETLASGQTYRIQGWTIIPMRAGIVFANDATSHGMVVGAGQDVKAF